MYTYTYSCPTDSFSLRAPVNCPADQVWADESDDPVHQPRTYKLDKPINNL